MASQNPITYAIGRVKFEIPREILEKCFITGGRHRYKESRSLDSLIRELVIEERVMEDVELLGSTFIQLPVKSSWVSSQGTGESLIRVPLSATQGRLLTRVTSVELGSPLNNISNPLMYSTGNATMNAVKGVMDSRLPPTVTNTPYYEYLDNNMIFVQDLIIAGRDIFVNGYIAADENFNNLSKSAWMIFAELCELATKAYVYNNLSIKIDRAQLDGGQELGKFSEIVDGYSDANEMYKEVFKEKWKKTIIMTDPKSKERFHRSLIGRLY